MSGYKEHQASECFSALPQHAEREPVGVAEGGRNLWLSERVHGQMVGLEAREERIDCPELTGQNQLGQPLVGAHQHAHLLPVNLDGDQNLDHRSLSIPTASMRFF